MKTCFEKPYVKHNHPTISNFKEYIVHKTGHGLGMDVHEDPYVMRKNHELLEEGMVITIEPGLYLSLIHI